MYQNDLQSPFVDNFVLKVLVADYMLKSTGNKCREYMYVGSSNKAIHELLAASGTQRCKVKAIGLIQVKEEEKPTEEELQSMPYKDPSKIAKQYYYQQYKVACANVQFAKVLQFLREKKYQNHGLFLNDIDVTKDYAGSFNKHEVIEHMVEKKGFRCQGTYGDGERTILDNSGSVSENCLTYMETNGKNTTRCKIYNKMVQMLECKEIMSVAIGGIG